MTKTEAVEKHRILWRAIAENIEKIVEYRYQIQALKVVLISELFPEEDYPLNYCFLCEYCMGKSKNKACECGYCPLLDTNCEDDTGCLNGKYAVFSVSVKKASETKNWDDAREKALEIANLPIVN